MRYIKRKANNHLIYFIIIVLMVLTQGCKPTRLLTNDQYLLCSNKTVIDSKGIDKGEIQAYYRQTPNTKSLMLFKFRLAVYNFSQLGKQRKWKSWMARVIGEEPVIYDSLYVSRTTQQFEKFLKNQGYYDAKVSHETLLHKKKAWVTYSINLNKPIIIKNVRYSILDTLLQPIILADTVNSMLTSGMLFSLSNLENERNRIVNQLLGNGYYDFNVDYFRYKIDTNNNIANVEIVINTALRRNADNSLSEVPHKKYWVNKVFFLPNFDPQQTIKNRSEYFNTFDTICYHDFNFIYSGKQNLKPKVLLRGNSITQGTLYNNSQVNQTLANLNELRLFRLNNANFYKEPTNDSLLNCNIFLTPSTLQNFSVNFETTNTSGNLGIGGNLNYQHKNVFKGAEILTLRFSGSFQRQSKSGDSPAFNIFENGFEAKLETPSFIIPFKNEEFEKSKHPKTFFSVSYNYQHRPDYNRKISNLSMGYQWKKSESIQFVVSPVDLSSVDVIPASDNFYDSIATYYPYLVNNFKDYFIAGGNYSLIYQSKNLTKSKNNRYIRWNFGLAGNLLYMLNNLGMGDTVSGGYYQVFDRQYAQYVSTDIDHRYYYTINSQRQFINRVFAGIVVPFGNTDAVPFVKQYFAGGAQGIRAWRPKDLGPGSSSDSLKSQYPNQMADLKLETNFEYRFTYSKSWKGAIFLDIGNIWSIDKNEPRAGAAFNFKTFYKEFAIGTGFGLRYDLDFAVFRLDWGLPVRNPKFEKSESWVLFHKPLEFSDFIWNVAIGYPF